MTYPAMRTFPEATTTSFEGLKEIKAGQEFILDGYHYRAKADASAFTRFGYDNVHIDAVRKHGGMPSGWELATVCEHRKIEEAA